MPTTFRYLSEISLTFFPTMICETILKVSICQEIDCTDEY